MTQLPVKAYIRDRKKQSYAVVGEQTAFTIDCADGVNHLTVSEKVEQVLRKITVDMAREYPHSIAFKEALCRHWAPQAHLAPAQIFLGEGSQNLLLSVSRLFLRSGDRVLGVAPSYTGYISDVTMWGAAYEPVLLREERRFRFDCGEFLARMDGSCRLVYLDNPNNPTGQAISLEDLERVAKRAAELSLPVLVDEAYGSYLPADESAISLMDRYDNVLVLRSFSKAYGLAGCRLGYLAVPEQLSNAMNNISSPYAGSAPSRLIAQAAMEDADFLRRAREASARQKKPFLQDRGSLSVSCTHPDTNILLLTHKNPDIDLARAFAKFGIRVVSGASFMGLRANSVRFRPPQASQQETVLEALELISRMNTVE